MEATNHIRVRRDALGIALDSLAGAAGLSEARLAALEAGTATATHGELRRLSAMLSLDLADFDPDEDAEPRELPGVATLLKSSGGYLRPHDWPRVVEAAEVARAIVALEQWRGRPARFDQLLSTFPPDGRFGEPVWRDGERLAKQLREALGLGTQPIPSMLKVCERLGIVVIEAYLPDGVSALCFADRAHGPTVVLNLQGANEHPFVRRFALAHEVCHILFDRYDLEPLQRLDRETGFYAPRDKPREEVRSDAFAIHLLAPGEVFRERWDAGEASGVSPEERIRALMEHFGVSFTATRGHARNLHLLTGRDAAELSDVDTSAPPAFVVSERSPSATERFKPLARERRGELLVQTLHALDEGVIGVSKALELLGVSGDELAAQSPRWREDLGWPPSTR